MQVSAQSLTPFLMDSSANLALKNKTLSAETSLNPALPIPLSVAAHHYSTINPCMRTFRMQSLTDFFHDATVVPENYQHIKLQTLLVGSME